MTEPFPQRVDLIPPGMTVMVDRVSFAEGEAPCWLYRSEGMAALGQPELIISLRADSSDEPRGLLRDPLELLKVLFERAQAGGGFRAGDWTELGASGVFGRADLRGLAYLPWPELPKLDASWSATSLAVVPLTGAELEVVKVCGAMRIAARLGQAQRFFPFPPWLERDRPDQSEPGELGATLLASVRSSWLAPTHATKVGDLIELELPRGATGLDAVAAAPSGAALALLALPSPRATALLSWRPGQESPRAHAGPGGDLSRLAGNFCLLVSDQESDEGQLIEDGFAMQLTQSSWQRLEDALRSRAPADFPSPSGLGLALRWQ